MIKMHKWSIQYFGWLMVICCFNSCDPFHPVLIANQQSESVTIIANTTIYFSTFDTTVAFTELGGTYNHKRLRFELFSGQVMGCGHAIAGIENEMPFTSLQIISSHDTIFANNQNQILDLFEHNFWGRLKRPYRLIIQ